MQTLVSTFAYLEGEQLRCSAVTTFGPIMVTFHRASWALSALSAVTVLGVRPGGEKVLLSFFNGETAETVMSLPTRRTLERMVEKNTYHRSHNTAPLEAASGGVSQHRYLALLIATPLLTFANVLLMDVLTATHLSTVLLFLANIGWATVGAGYTFAICRHLYAMKRADWRLYFNT